MDRSKIIDPEAFMEVVFRNLFHRVRTFDCCDLVLSLVSGLAQHGSKCEAQPLLDHE